MRIDTSATGRCLFPRDIRKQRLVLRHRESSSACGRLRSQIWVQRLTPYFNCAPSKHWATVSSVCSGWGILSRPWRSGWIKWLAVG